MAPTPLNYRTFGEGTPFVILHGLYGAGSNFNGVARRLSASFRVYTPDLRNHGGSGHRDSMDYREMAHDIEHFLDMNCLERVIMLGHSMGGKIAMTFAHDYPERLDDLIIVDVAPIEYDLGHYDLQDKLASVDIRQFDCRRDVDRYFASLIPEDGVRRFLLKNLVVDSRQGNRWRTNMDVISRDLYKILAPPPVEPDWTYQDRALFVYGEESPYFVEEMQQAVVDMFPEATFTGIEGVGHWVHMDEDLFVEVLMQYLETA